MERRQNNGYADYFDQQFDLDPVEVGVGSFACTRDPKTMLVTNVGSGVVLCVYDNIVHFGGMAHILVPEKVLRQFPHFDPDDPLFRQTERLMESFINALKENGVGKQRVRIKLMGGGALYEGIIDTGLQNYVFAKEHLLQKGMRIAQEDIGGRVCRRIYYIPIDGRIVSHVLRRKEDILRLKTIEREYLHNTEQTS